MSDRPKNPFRLAARQDQAHLREKDNAAPRVPPPQQAMKPAPNLAPPGMAGVKRDLPSQTPERSPFKSLREAFQSQAAPRFKPIPPREPDKDQTPER